MAAILFRIPMVLYKMATILSKAKHHWETKRHWKTKQRATIGIPNAFGIPAPTVLGILGLYLTRGGRLTGPPPCFGSVPTYPVKFYKLPDTEAPEPVLPSEDR